MYTRYCGKVVEIGVGAQQSQCAPFLGDVVASSIECCAKVGPHRCGYFGSKDMTSLSQSNAFTGSSVSVQGEHDTSVVDSGVAPLLLSGHHFFRRLKT